VLGRVRCLPALGLWVCKADGTATECKRARRHRVRGGLRLPGHDCDGQTDEDFIQGASTTAEPLADCSTNCTTIYALANAYGGLRFDADDARVPDALQLVVFRPERRLPDDGCEFHLDSGAIYVSGTDPAARNDSGCGSGPVGTGTGNYPCLTIGYGMNRATTTSRTRVLVADGQYVETITMLNGMSLFGGYRADTWEAHVGSSMTIVRGTGTLNGHRVTVDASTHAITSATQLSGFVV